MKVAIITPYAGEPASIVARCRSSVRAQDFADITHYLINDGSDEIPGLDTAANVRVIRLGNRHNDFGNTARAVGGMCALNSGAEVICYLDVDNEYFPPHVSDVVAAFQSAPVAAVFGKRRVRLPEYPDSVACDSADENAEHVDTNCIALGPGGAFLLPMWGLMPPELSVIGDMVLVALIRHFALAVGKLESCTVTYWSRHASHYRSAGVPVPADAKQIDPALINLAFDPARVWQRMRLNLSLGVRGSAREPTVG